MPVAVDVSDRSALGVETIGDEVFLPQSARRSGFTRVLVPPDAVGYPAGGDEVGKAVMVDIDGPLAAVGDELAVDADGTELVLLPIAALGSGVFVPIGSAEDIGEAVAVHVEGSDSFCVVVA